MICKKQLLPQKSLAVLSTLSWVMLIMSGCSKDLKSRIIKFPHVISLDTIRGNEIYSFEIKSTNNSNVDLQVLDVKGSCSCISTNVNFPITVKANSIYKLQLAMVPDVDSFDQKSEIIMIRTNDDSIFHKVIVNATVLGERAK